MLLIMLKILHTWSSKLLKGKFCSIRNLVGSPVVNRFMENEAGESFWWSFTYFRLECDRLWVKTTQEQNSVWRWSGSSGTALNSKIEMIRWIKFVTWTGILLDGFDRSSLIQLRKYSAELSTLTLSRSVSPTMRVTLSGDSVKIGGACETTTKVARVFLVNKSCP